MQDYSISGAEIPSSSDGPAGPIVQAEVLQPLAELTDDPSSLRPFTFLMPVLMPVLILGLIVSLPLLWVSAKIYEAFEGE